MLNSLTDKVKAIFSRKQASDDARFQDVHEAVTTVSEHVQKTSPPLNSVLPRWKPPLRR
jgi:hypothetical protein